MGKSSAGVYIHIPFCRRKCVYCDFHSVPGRETVIGDYVDSVIGEIRENAGLLKGKEVVSLFFGGGTPSLLEPRHVGRILDACARYFHCASSMEISIEANPESVTVPRFRGYKKAGVNRVSVGIQSLDDDSLALLGRIHTADKARRSVDVIFNTGFANVSADLMFALPGQSLDKWITQLEEVVTWNLVHLSCYELTVGPSTRLAGMVSSGEITPRGDNLEFFKATEKTLGKHGFSHYEISNYAIPGGECVHNLGYWLYRDYLGVGAGAHSKISSRRWANVKSIGGYMTRIAKSGKAVYRSETLLPETTRYEKLMLGLRLKDGVLERDISPSPELDALVSEGWLKRSSGKIRASDRHWPLLNSVLERL